MKIDRLLGITMALLNNKRLSATELAERFEVSLRTIYRDIETISQAGIPIISFPGSKGGFEIMPGYHLNQQYFSFEDFVSIYNALREVQLVTNNHDILALLEKIGALIPDLKPIHLSNTFCLDLSYSSSPNEKSKIRLLQRAIRASRLISFTYMDIYGQETERTIEPMGIYSTRQAWYIWGYCLMRSDLRIFRLSRISQLKPCLETFIRRNLSIQDIDDKRSQPLNRIKALLRFKTTVKTRVRDEFDANQIKMDSDGSLIVTTYYFSIEEAVQHILSFSIDVTDIKPLSLANELRHRIAKMSQFYKDNAEKKRD